MAAAEAVEAAPARCHRAAARRRSDLADPSLPPAAPAAAPPPMSSVAGVRCCGLAAAGCIDPLDASVQDGGVARLAPSPAAARWTRWTRRGCSWPRPRARRVQRCSATRGLRRCRARAGARRVQRSPGAAGGGLCGSGGGACRGQGCRRTPSSPAAAPVIRNVRRGARGSCGGHAGAPAGRVVLRRRPVDGAADHANPCPRATHLAQLYSLCHPTLTVTPTPARISSQSPTLPALTFPHTALTSPLSRPG